MARQMPVLQNRPISGAYFQHGICVLESHHSSHFFMEWSKSRDLTVLYILNGTGRLRMKTGEYPMRKGNVLILPRKTIYRIADHPGAPLSIWLLGIHNPEIEAWCRLAGIEACHRSTNPVVSSLVQNLFKKLMYENTIRRAAWELVMVSLALEMLGILVREKIRTKRSLQGDP